jgi:hypothetical protein
MHKSVIWKIVGGCCALALAAAVAWFATMPYPVRMWWESKTTARYSASWRVSRADYAAAKRLVQRELGLREIIWSVRCAAPDEITSTTLERWTGPLAASGREFTVKRVGREWQIPGGVLSSWVS